MTCAFIVTCANVLIIVAPLLAPTYASFIEYPINSSDIIINRKPLPMKHEKALILPPINLSPIDLPDESNSLASIVSETVDNSTDDLLDSKKFLIPDDDTGEEFAIVSSAHANVNLRPLSTAKRVTDETTTMPSRDDSTKDPHTGIGSSLIPSLAFLLSQSYAAYLNDTETRKGASSTKTISPNFSHMMSLDQDEDLMPSDSILSPVNAPSGGVSSFTSWLKNTVLGSKWRANRKPDDRSNLHSHAPYQSPFPPPLPHLPHHHHHIPSMIDAGEYQPEEGGGGGPPPGGPLHFLPSPEGFPTPYSPQSVMLPPEALQDSGIMYWLNYIEQAAKDKEQNSNEEKRIRATNAPVTETPLQIGEKPTSTSTSNKFRPNSIRDEIDSSSIDNLEGSVDEDMPPGDKKSTVNKVSTGGLLELHSTSSGQRTSAEEPLNTEASAPRCDKFTSSICIDDFEYPEQAIVDEIYKRREIFELMYSEDGPSAGASPSASSPAATGLVDGIPAHTEESYSYSSSSPKKVSAGYVCPSEVLYGRPKLAKNMANEWKVIVNAGDFTQTLRMEKCLNPNAACSYIMPHLETRCAQVHSIHRLMVFEKGRGFFVESFKIPTGCTCHIVRSKHNSNKGNRHRNNFDQGDINSAALSLLHQQQHQQQQQQQNINGNLASLSNQNSLLAALHGLQQKQALVQRLKNNPNSLIGSSSAMPLLDITQANNQPQGNGNRMPTNNPMTNSLWSLLMGQMMGNAMGNTMADSSNKPSTSDLLSQLGLLAHLRQMYPDIASQINPESLLHPKLSSRLPGSNRKNNIQSMIKNNKNSINNHHLQQQLQMSQSSPQQLSGTTIVNPLAMAAGGQVPLVQVIHVPVSSSPAIQSNTQSPSIANSPNLMSMTSPMLTAYDTQTNTTLANSTHYHNDNRFDTGLQETDDDYDNHDTASNYYRSVKRNGSVYSNVSKVEEKNETSSETEYVASKLKFNHKINFNYHPILEYIPSVSTVDTITSTMSDTSTPFIPYFPRSYVTDDKKTPSSSASSSSSSSSSSSPGQAINDTPLNLLNSHLLTRNH